MTETLHFIRPYWFLALAPLMFVIYKNWYRYSTPDHTWDAICDRHLQPSIIQMNVTRQRIMPLLLLSFSAVFMIISLSGPTWSRLPVSTYKPQQPRVLILDLSDEMLVNDRTPNRLTRAKFKLHDILQHRDVGQFALVIYTDEAFVVSPLTDDGQTIDALLSSLEPGIMPINGNHLEQALNEAEQLITHAGFTSGQILILTAHPPSTDSISKARALANHGIYSSIIDVSLKHVNNASFIEFARAGKTKHIQFTDTDDDINQWLTHSQSAQQYRQSQNQLSVWQDQGRWFLIPAMLFFLPAFRRGWLQRINI